MADEDWALAAQKQEQKILSEISTLSIAKDGSKASLVQPPDETDEKVITAAEKSTLQKILRTKLVTSKHDVEVQRKNPNSPLYSVKSFQALNLCPELLRGVFEMGFDAPSKIQETALPTLLADPPQNMIAQSQSGTGKTAAFVLAMLSRVDPNQNYTQALCLSPTYELALQIGEVAKKMAKFTKIEFRFAVRGKEVERGTKIKEHIVIGTPGKVMDWATKWRFLDLKRLKVFVLDEADVMIAQQGHQEYSIKIHKALPNTCQMMLFSATYEQEVMTFAEAIIPNAVVIRLRREEESLDNIKQYFALCNSSEQKYSAIVNLYGVITVGQAMIFCHTRKTASWLSVKLTNDGHSVALLSGELDINQRINILDRYREGKEKVLITTNVLARGIDVEQVTIVINFDLPIDQKGRADCETYLHRIGRTGRFGKSGIAVNLVDGQRNMNVLNEIQDHFGREIRKLDVEDVDEIEKLES